MVLETILGSALGGILRLVPEVLKWLDRKGERAHELEMFDREIRLEELRMRGVQAEIREYGKAIFDKAAVDALRAAVTAQGKGGGILSSMVRPVITLAFFGMWAGIKVKMLLEGGVYYVWTYEDQALWAGILNFWFMGRVFEKVLR